MIQVSVETTSNLGRRLSVAVPAEKVEEEIKTRLANVMKTAKVEGFRPGKAPVRIVEQRYGNTVRSEAIENLLQSSLNAALVQEKLQPAVSPIIQSIKADKGQPLEYIATFEIYPEVKLQTLSDITLEKRVVKITKADVDRVLGQIRKQHANWIEVNRAAEEGDRITFDLHWTDPQDPTKIGEQKKILLILEEGATPPEFVNLKGTKKDEEVKLSLPLQGDPYTTSIPGSAHILKVEAPELPTLDDKFATRLDVVGGIEALRTEVQKHMEIQLEDTLKNEIKVQVIDQFLARHPIELPNELVERETQALEQELKVQIQRQMPQNPNQPISNQVRENLINQARRRVSLSILFAAFAKEHPIQIDKDRIQKRIEQIATSFQGSTAEVAESLFRNKEVINRIRSQVFEDQLVEKLMEQIKYTETKASYADVVKLKGLPGSTDHENFEHPDCSDLACTNPDHKH